MSWPFFSHSYVNGGVPSLVTASFTVSPTLAYSVATVGGAAGAVGCTGDAGAGVSTFVAAKDKASVLTSAAEALCAGVALVESRRVTRAVAIEPHSVSVDSRSV